MYDGRFKTDPTPPGSKASSCQKGVFHSGLAERATECADQFDGMKTNAKITTTGMMNGLEAAGNFLVFVFLSSEAQGVTKCGKFQGGRGKGASLQGSLI